MSASAFNISRANSNTAQVRSPKFHMDPRDNAQYIADMALELRNLAKTAELSSIQSLLELVYYEAYTAANRVDVSAEELERLKSLGDDAKRAERGKD